MDSGKIIPMDPEELTEFERHLVANAARIEILLKGATRMEVRQIAEVLAKLAGRISRATHDKRTNAEILMESHHAIEEAKWAINKIRPNVKQRRRKMAEELLRRRNY